jgi:DNA-binding NtrC family response regulator
MIGMTNLEQNLSVLLVDDEQGFVEALARRLSRRGFSVRTALSGRLGLAELARQPAQVVVLDLKMADMDGETTLKRIKVLYPGLPVVLLTGHASMESLQSILEMGAYDYLSKPCDLETLVERIQAAADGSVE